MDYRVRDPIFDFPNARYKKPKGFVLQSGRIVGIVGKMFIRLSEHQVRSELRSQRSELFCRLYS